MSKAVQANASLIKARELKKLGYKHRMFLPELAPFKEWFDAEYNKGGQTVGSLHKLGKNKFPKLDIPSLPSIHAYIKNHYTPPAIVLTGYSPDYLATVKEFDAYLKLIEHAKEVLSRYHEAKAKEKLPVTRKGSESYQWATMYQSALNDIATLEIKLRIRDGVTVPDTLNLTQNNVDARSTHVHTTQPISVDDAIQILDDKGKLDELERSVRAIAEQRAAANPLPVE